MEIRPAATVVVLRPGASHPFDVLMVRRSEKVAFMAGAYVFPGGRVDDGDAPSPADACDGLAAMGRAADLAPADEARYRIAGIRELLEEAGVLLARRGGTFVDAATAAELRAALDAETPLVPLLATHGLTAALDAVMPFAHWVTPDFESRRFDTRFLLARMPGAQEASHDAGETTALEWVAPETAIGRARAGEIALPPPTWVTLARLAVFASIDAAWDWASRTPIVRIQPGFVHEGECTTVMLPGDPTYPLPAGCEPLAETRFHRGDGHWRPVRAGDA